MGLCCCSHSTSVKPEYISPKIIRHSALSVKSLSLRSFADTELNNSRNKKYIEFVETTRYKKQHKAHVDISCWSREHIALTASSDHKTFLWDINNDPRAMIKDVQVSTACWSDDGKTLALGTENGLVNFFTYTGAPFDEFRPVETINEDGNQYAVMALKILGTTKTRPILFSKENYRVFGHSCEILKSFRTRF